MLKLFIFLCPTEKIMAESQDPSFEVSLSGVPRKKLGRKPQLVSFNKILKVCPEHHEALLMLQAHYLMTYRDPIPVTWLLYKILDEYFSCVENIAPRYPMLDAVQGSRPKDRPLGRTGMLGDLESFLLVTQNDADVARDLEEAVLTNEVPAPTLDRFIAMTPPSALPAPTLDKGVNVAPLEACLDPHP
jgi:hypothetical protein